MKNKHNNDSYIRNAVALIVILLAFIIILPRLSSFNQSLLTLRNADFVYVGAAVAIWLTTFFSAAFVYKLIALRPLIYSRTLLVQLSSGFTNRLAPLGAGILALNISYLVKRGHTGSQAAAIVALNNLLGFISTVILLLGLLILHPVSFSNSFDVHIHLPTIWLVSMGILLIIGLYVLTVYGRKLFKKATLAVKSVLPRILGQPRHLLLALMASLAITVGYSATLYVIGLACNAHFSLGQALLVMTLGVLAASVTPTPGGIGGAEVGLVGALIAVGITSHQALTVALLYRFLTFWLPILPGFICFQIILRKRYI
jgi:uncharacterized membrane protein YbhN (UPF0104 family)